MFYITKNEFATLTTSVYYGKFIAFEPFARAVTNTYTRHNSNSCHLMKINLGYTSKLSKKLLKYILIKRNNTIITWFRN